MPTPEQVLDGAEIKWIPCPGCAGEIGIPPHWLAHTVACPKCGAIVSIDASDRVLWRPPKPASKEKLKLSSQTFADQTPQTFSPAQQPPAKPVAPSLISARCKVETTRPRTGRIALLGIVLGFLLHCLLLAVVGMHEGEAAGAREGRLPSSRDISTNLFGIEAEGKKFVYVFDRSFSMGSSSPSALETAKRELLKSLAALHDTNQFQIIFYNERFMSINSGRQNGGMLLADRHNLELAQKYVHGIMADGGTRQAEPIEAALRLTPDAIFILTDSELPAIPDGELARIRGLNGGRTVIHTIELGLGAPPSRENSLGKLARQNGGKYAYVDLSN